MTCLSPVSCCNKTINPLDSHSAPKVHESAAAAAAAIAAAIATLGATSELICNRRNLNSH